MRARVCSRCSRFLRVPLPLPQACAPIVYTVTCLLRVARSGGAVVRAAGGLDRGVCWHPSFG